MPDLVATTKLLGAEGGLGSPSIPPVVTPLLAKDTEAESPCFAQLPQCYRTRSVQMAFIRVIA